MKRESRKGETDEKSKVERGGIGRINRGHISSILFSEDSVPSKIGPGFNFGASSTPPG